MTSKGLIDPLLKLIRTKVIYKDGTLYCGYFKAFDDHESLKNEGKYRLIPEDKALAIKKEYAKTKKLNKSYSIVINLQQVEDIELLRN